MYHQFLEFLNLESAALDYNYSMDSLRILEYFFFKNTFELIIYFDRIAAIRFIRLNSTRIDITFFLIDWSRLDKGLM